MTTGGRSADKVARARAMLERAIARRKRADLLAQAATIRLSEAEEAESRAHVRLSKALGGKP
jgi:hypothetical protein